MLAVRIRPPEHPGSWGYCPWLAVTGLPCPSCGGLRALSALSRGDLPVAMAQHGYLVLSALAVTGLWIAWAVHRARGRTGGPPGLPGAAALPWILVAWVTGLLAFTGLRWLPGWQWLGPVAANG